MNSRTLRKKITLLGDVAVGKTSLIQRFVYNVFDDRYITTFGAKVTRKPMAYTVEQNPQLPMDTTLSLLIWDLAGQKAFRKVHQAYYRGAEAALIVCDVTRKGTLHTCDKWAEDLFEVVGKVPAIMLVNKMDLEHMRAVTEEEIEEFAKQNNLPYYFTSAKTGNNVECAFDSISQLMLQVMHPRTCK